MLGVGILSGIAQTQNVDPKVPQIQNAAEVLKYDRIGWHHSNKLTKPKTFGSRAASSTNGIEIGNTRYDLQSNAAIDDRIVMNADGTMSAVFTMAHQNAPAYTDRGAGYLYHNGTSWVTNSPQTRVESERSGWPSIGVTKSGREIIIAHSTATDQLIMNYRASKNTGSWTEVKDPTGAVPEKIGGRGYLLWPRMVIGGANGETVHLIALTEPEPVPGGTGTFQGKKHMGLSGAITYSRSKDGGMTWDTRHVVLPGLDSSKFNGFGGDNYAIDARGDVIAIVAFQRFGHIAMLKSTDNGDTWTTSYPYRFPTDKYELGDFPVTDTLDGCDGAGDIHVDSKGEVHVAYGTWTWTDADTTNKNANGDHLYSAFQFMNGMNYWKESYGENGAQRLVGFIDQDGNPNNIGIVGAGSTFDGLTNYGSKSLTGYPVLASDATGGIYCTFMAIMETKTGKSYNDGTRHYRHQFVIKSKDGGCVWGDPMDLTDDGSGFEECVYGTMPSKVTDSVRVIYMEDQAPGTEVGPVGQANNHGDFVNKIIYIAKGVNELPSNNGTCLTVIKGAEDICPGDSIYLDASPSCGSAYKWNNNSATSGIWVKAPGTYSCDITTPCGTVTKSVVVGTPTINGPGPRVSLTSDDANLCPAGSQTVLRVKHSSIGTSGFYNWNGSTNASTIDTTLITSPGTYTVKVTNCVGGSSDAKIVIGSVSSAKANITGRNALCPGETTTLEVNTNPDGTYVWRKSGSANVLGNSTKLSVNSTGTYVVDVTACNGTFSAKDSIDVIVEPAPTAILTPSGLTSICVGSSKLDLVASGQTGATFKWFDGSKGNKFSVNTDSVHTFKYFFYSYNTCGDSTKSTEQNVEIKALPSAPTITYTSPAYSAGGSQVKWYVKPRGGAWTYTGKDSTHYIPTNLNAGDSVAAKNETNGCESVLSNSIGKQVSIAEFNTSGSSISVYPNPSNGVLRMSFVGISETELTISVKNMVGQEVYLSSVELSGDMVEELNLSKLGTGMYLLTITDGVKKHSERIVIR